jgi:hypothetical protein
VCADIFTNCVHLLRAFLGRKALEFAVPDDLGKRAGIFSANYTLSYPGQSVPNVCLGWILN